MSLKLNRPLITFDLETTGKETFSARIISISLIKEFPDGSSESKTRLIHPTINIPPDSTAIHSITDEMVKDCNTFQQVSKGLFEFMSGCDFLTFNGDNFDIPILAEEFLRCGISFPETGYRSIDAFSIFKKVSPRTLAAAVKTYCGHELEDAHNAEADTKATNDVFKAQIKFHEELSKLTFDELVEFSNGEEKKVDLAGKILLDEDGDYIYGIGDNRGKKIKNDTGFANWMLGKTFTLQTKATIVRILKEIEDAK